MITPFISSLNPSEKAKADSSNRVLIDGLEIGNEITVEAAGTVVLITRKSELEFEVWDIWAKFSNGLPGCVIQRLQEPESRQPKAVFHENCHTVTYDKDGNILPGSHKSALPMVKMKYSLRDGDLYVW
ncbi:MAG: hypothetical protein AseanaTS_03780 [Candidatus Pelagadaptatus aseana]